MSFQFDLTQAVTVGEVLGRSEYVPALGENSYFVEYIHPTTKLPTRDWFPESQIVGV